MTSIFSDLTIENKYYLSILKDLCGGTRVIDLLLLPPSHYKSLEQENSTLTEGEQILEVTVYSHQPSFKISVKSPYKILCGTKGGEILTLIFFAGNAGLWKGMFKEKQSYLLSCKVVKMGKAFSASHPKILKQTEIARLKETGEVVIPIYPLVAGLTQSYLAGIILKHIKFTEEIASEELKTAIKHLHFPANLTQASEAKNLLAKNEILAKNVAHFLASASKTKVQSCGIKTTPNLFSLAPFELTQDQQNALHKIFHLQSQEVQNTTLLQGDVGSGKTIIAILSAINAVNAGLQVAVMAPTAILAKQLFVNFSKIAQSCGIEIIFFSGEDRGKKRNAKLSKIQNGEVKIAIGTHALFSSDVIFQKLGYVIIDEQHRFGIKQRLELTAKSIGAKVLLMTATPIPRTLSMAMYGEIEMIDIKVKPKNRKDIITRIFTKDKLPEIIEAIKRKIEANEGVYWVVPLILEGEDEKVQKTSIEARHKELLKYFKQEEIGVIHGKRQDAEIEEEMAKFLKGERKIILATTVIEVGVDAPHATVIIIEEAESFGLATLHQLRGRVGRGELQSYCFLLPSLKSEETLARLKIIANSNDGFFIAEKDMELRGSGAIFSKMQSGFEGFKFFEISTHKSDLTIAQKTAKEIIMQDPKLETPKGEGFKLLLKIFNYENYLDFIKI